MAIWRMRIACWIPKATNTHSEYVILLFHCNIVYPNASQCCPILHCLSLYRLTQYVAASAQNYAQKRSIIDNLSKK